MQTTRQEELIANRKREVDSTANTQEREKISSGTVAKKSSVSVSYISCVEGLTLVDSDQFHVISAGEDKMINRANGALQQEEREMIPLSSENRTDAGADVAKMNDSDLCEDGTDEVPVTSGKKIVKAVSDSILERKAAWKRSLSIHNISCVKRLTPVDLHQFHAISAGEDKMTKGANGALQQNEREIISLCSENIPVDTNAKVTKMDDSDLHMADLDDRMGEIPVIRIESVASSLLLDKAISDSILERLKPENVKIPSHIGLDTASTYSLYMENDLRYYFQQPYARLFVAYFVTFCNFLMYAEDPVAHSRAECYIPVIGQFFTFVCRRYPPNAWSLLKVVLWLAGTVAGMVVGKLFFHTFLFNKILRLKMFTDDKGSWMTMFFATIFTIFLFSYIYNGFLLIGGDSTLNYRITSYMSVANNDFTKVAATGTWCGDFITAWMVTDMMLQENLYPMWARKLRKWWNIGYRRIILFWVVVVTSSFIVIFVITSDYIEWDKLNRDFLHTNELSRAFLASFILIMDVFIVMQDWDFPHFIGAIDIKLPGVNSAHIRFKIRRLLTKLEYWHIHICGKWFNYGILFFVLLLDLNMWKNQTFYAPSDYGQYVDPDGRIHSIQDTYSLTNYNETFLSYSYRNATIDPITGKRYIELDTTMNARFQGYAQGTKVLAFIPSIFAFIVFGTFVWVYGRQPKPTKDDPYGGRLKRRRKRGLSFRLGLMTMRKRFHSTGNALSAIRKAELEARLREEEYEESDQIS